MHYVIVPRMNNLAQKMEVLQQIARELTADSNDDDDEVNKMNGMGDWHLFELLSIITCTWQIE